MANSQPGLAPRKLEGEVDNSRIIDKLPDVPTNVEQPSVERPVDQAQVSDNTEATTKQTEGNGQEAQVEQPVTPRADQRIQTLANEKAQAEARAQQAEAMLQRLVNVQPQQPVLSEQEILGKQYRTYDPAQGYPTDPREYAHFVAAGASLAAAQTAQRESAQQRTQNETAEFVRAYPNATSDPVFMGAMSAIKADAQKRGAYLSYKDAADLANKQLNERVSKRVIADVANNDASKDEAYVESTRGASASNRAGSTPDIDKMSLEEKEAWLKQNGAW